MDQQYSLTPCKTKWRRNETHGVTKQRTINNKQVGKHARILFSVIVIKDRTVTSNNVLEIFVMT